MRCDFCGCKTEKNFFNDDLTILCERCATAGGFSSGKDAVQFIKQQTQGGKK